MRKIKQQIVEIPEYYCDNCNDRIYDKNPLHCILCKKDLCQKCVTVVYFVNKSVQAYVCDECLKKYTMQDALDAMKRYVKNVQKEVE